MADNEPEVEAPSRALPDDALPSMLVGSLSSIWTAAKPEQRAEYIQQIMASYTSILHGFLDEANRQVGLANTAQRSHQRWRIRLIVLTGLVALLNLVAMQETNITRIMTGVAGGAAVVLAIFTNLESFFNWSERAQINRESRELFLDAYREFDMLWNTHVLPYYGMSEACINAAILYRRITTKDQDLRRKLKQLTTTDKNAGGG